MQIKTITKNRSSASLRKVTLGHAVRILVSEVLQAGGLFVYSWPRHDVRTRGETMMPYLLANAEGFVFSTDDASYEFRGNEQEIERFDRIVELAIKAGSTRASKFDGYSQKVWMLSVLHHYEQYPEQELEITDLSLYKIADTIDEIINRHGVVTLAA